MSLEHRKKYQLFFPICVHLLQVLKRIKKLLSKMSYLLLISLKNIPFLNLLLHTSHISSSSTQNCSLVFSSKWFFRLTNVTFSSLCGKVNVLIEQKLGNIRFDNHWINFILLTVFFTTSSLFFSSFHRHSSPSLESILKTPSRIL